LGRTKYEFFNNKEKTWDINKMTGLVDVQGKCIKPIVLIVNKNARSRSSQVETAQYTVKNAFRNARTAAVKKQLSLLRDAQKLKPTQGISLKEKTL